MGETGSGGVQRKQMGIGPKQGIYEQSSVKVHNLGDRFELSDGREFVYCLNGAVELAPALLNTVISTPTHEDTVTIAHPIGTTTVTVTAGGISANAFAEGYLIVTGGTGIGEMYKIKGNTATVSGLITVDLYDPLATAWVIANTDVDLYINPYNALVVNVTDAQQKPVCVTLRTVTIAYYFWGQVKGFAALQLDVNSAAGLELDEKYIQASTNHAGLGMLTTTPADADMKHIIGELVKEEDVADNTVTLVNLMLA